MKCPDCKGTDRDPRNRKRRCQNTFCSGGQIDPEGMCDCECHDGASIMHVLPCCRYSGSQRHHFDAVVSEAAQAELAEAHEVIELAIDKMRGGHFNLALAALQKVSRRYDG